MAPEFNIEAWPEFSIYNAFVANLWPVYWVARLIDPLKLDQVYWDVFEGAAARAAEIHQAVVLLRAKAIHPRVFQGTARFLRSCNRRRTSRNCPR